MSRRNEFVILNEFRRLIYAHMLSSGLCLEAIIGGRQHCNKTHMFVTRSQNSVVGYYVELSQPSSELHNVFYLTVTSVLIISPLLSSCTIIHSFIPFIRSFIK
jgi:hypothetical protein